MNKDIFGGKWKQFRGEMRKQWGKLTDDELDQAKGNTEKLLGLVQERYGYTKDEALRRYNGLVESFNDDPAEDQVPPPRSDERPSTPARHA